MSATPLDRRHDLDWLRAIAILLLVFFHSAMPFVAEWGWHLKNAETSNLLLELNFFLSRWRMALLYLISGVGTAFALGRKSVGRFARERAKRLLVPLAFGILVVVPPQIYVERLAQGATYSSYLAFWPSIITTGPYPHGNLSYHHLWFVAYLAGYTALLLPLFAWLRGERLARAGARLDRVATRVGLPAFGFPLAVILVALEPHFPGPQDVVHDLAMLLYYMTYFAYGYVFAQAPALWERVTRERGTLLRWAVLGMLAVDYLRWNDLAPGIRHTPAGAAYGALLAFSAWCWVLALLGYARRYLSRGNALLRWANEAAYPVYILHQTVIVVLAYYILPLPDGVFAKFLSLSLLALAVTLLLYQTLVRPSPRMRLLFGMKPLDRGRDAGAGTGALVPAAVGAATPVPALAPTIALAAALAGGAGPRAVRATPPREMASWGGE